MPSPSSLPQTYVWLRPPLPVRRALEAHRQQWWWPRGSEQPRPHRLHLTLHALGTPGERQVDAAIAALRALRLPAFELELAWSGVWTGNGVAVACPRLHPALAQLHAASAQALGRQVPARSWTPHVTLGRNALHAGAALLPPLRWPVREFLLVRSWLPPHPVRHEVLAQLGLDTQGRAPVDAAGSSPGRPSWTNLYP